MTERKERITVSLPGELADQARRAVEAGEAPDVSAYIADAMRRKAAKQRDLAILQKIFDDIGTPGPEHDAWARKVLGVDQPGQAAA